MVRPSDPKCKESIALGCLILEHVAAVQPRSQDVDVAHAGARGQEIVERLGEEPLLRKRIARRREGIIHRHGLGSWLLRSGKPAASGQRERQSRNDGAW